MPYNPDIANILFRAGEVWTWGRCIDRIMVLEIDPCTVYIKMQSYVRNEEKDNCFRNQERGTKKKTW